MVVTDDTTGLAAAPASPFVVVFREGNVGIETLRRWRTAGAGLAVTVGDLEPRFSSRRVAGLLSVQVSPRSVRRLLATDEVAAPYGTPIPIDRRIVASLRADYQPNAGAINIAGYVAGKHPRRARDLVIVCSDLDAVGDFAGVQTIDLRHFAVGTSALLEVARNLGYVSRRWSLPERSVMLAVWSGARLGHQGLRYFLKDPTWSLRRITSVIYVGLDTEEEPAVRELLAEYGLPLHVIPVPKDLDQGSLVLAPDPVLVRLAQERSRIEQSQAFEAPVLPDLDVVVDSAVVRAEELAAAAYERMLFESTDPRPFYPAREDTLRRPPGADDESL